MGLLSLGTPLDWQHTKRHCNLLRDQGIAQLLKVWNDHKARQNDPPLWGDELEYMIVQFDDSLGVANLTLRQEDILDTLICAGKAKKFSCASFHQEYGRYMLEATPSEPYHAEKLERVELNMNHRRKIAREYLQGNEFPLTLTTYPLLGVGQFALPWDAGARPVSESLFLPDSIINTHARFPTLTANIRQRRGSKVDIRVPIYEDKDTKEKDIYMDAMGFGMGSSCLQITFQAANINEARVLYDQLIPFAPLFLALSAAAPLFRGHLSDQDVRWSVISASVDDRTPVERGVAAPPSDWAEHTNNTSPVIPKSRYSSVDCYISPETSVYNDVELVTNKRSFAQLKEAGMDDALATHFAHLFIRDPLVIFEEMLDQNEGTDHFENIQSTNWQTIRFKPPPGPEIGWRVEFRSMDVQITDFENSAFSIVLILLVRLILDEKLSFYMPISKVDENMDTAHKRSPTTQKYWWPGSSSECTLQTLDSILSPIFDRLKNRAEPHLHKYIDLVAERAANKRQPAATWIRNFVLGHSDYKHDSVVSATINYDLMQALKRVTLGDWEGTGDWLAGLHNN